MTTKISVSLSAVDEGFLKELKSKFGDHTRLDIQVVELDEDPPLTENEFWDIIAQLDWEAPSRDEVLHPAVRALAEIPLGHIYQFEDILADFPELTKEDLVAALEFAAMRQQRTAIAA